MAGTFVVIKKKIGLLNDEKRFYRDVTRLELIQAKVVGLEEVFDFAKEYAAFANHQRFSNIGERLYYYLTDGSFNYQKVADRFMVSVGTVASNVSYASKFFTALVGDQLNLITDALDIGSVQAALSEFRQIRKSVVNPLDLPEISEERQKSLLKRKKSKIGGFANAKNTSQIIIH